MLKKLFSLLTALTVAAAALMPAAATAQSESPPAGKDASSRILAGLWQGIDMATGSTGTYRTFASTTRSQSAPVPATAGAYVALGDSVAAGLGLPTKSTVPTSERRCGRTAEAYPNTVARAMSLPLVHKACSGATAGDLVTKQRRGSPNQPAQFDAAFAGGTPALITITAGANDARWDEFLRLCYSRDCANSSARQSTECIPNDLSGFTTTNLANCYLKLLQVKLHYALGSIQARSGNRPPTTVITGYYNPISPACTTATTRITAAEIAWLEAVTNALNQTIQGVAASYSFVRFAPVDFSGHDICSSSSWVQGLNSPAPFHPTVEGQQVIARSVLTALGR